MPEIDGQRFSFTQPICEDRWPLWLASEGMSPREPTRLKLPHPEKCCFCGRPTTSGIFIRVDPRTVPYPTPEEA